MYIINIWSKNRFNSKYINDWRGESCTLKTKYRSL